MKTILLLDGDVPDKLGRFERQVSLPHWGEDGQQKLAGAKVLVIGAGGLGCPALTYLATAGVGTIGIVDHDTVSLSNLHRQPLYESASIGEKKAVRAAARLEELNPDCRAEVFAEKFAVGNARQIAAGYDLIIDATDSFPSRYLINDIAFVLEKPFISAAIFQYEGQLSVFNARSRDGALGPTYRCLYPKMPGRGTLPSCAEAGVIPTLPGILGVLQAQEAIKLIVGLGEPLIGRLLIFDALSCRWQTRSFSRNSSTAGATRLLEEHEYSLTECETGQSAGISAQELKKRLEAGTAMLIDIREPWERELASLGGTHLPLAELIHRARELAGHDCVVLYCKSGSRSMHAVQIISERYGLSNFRSLEGGIAGWSKAVDQSIPLY